MELFKTLDEAFDNQVLCGTCGRPKKTVEGVYTADGEPYYQLVRCKKPFCRVHCSKTAGCTWDDKKR